MIKQKSGTIQLFGQSKLIVVVEQKDRPEAISCSTSIFGLYKQGHKSTSICVIFFVIPNMFRPAETCTYLPFYINKSNITETVLLSSFHS